MEDGTRDSLIVDFVPSTHEIMDSLRGDLNGDAYTDMLVLLRNKLENNGEGDFERTLILLLGQQNGFSKAATSNKIVYCLNCGGAMGDPYVGMQFDSVGKFSVYHYGGSNWRWTRDLNFGYDSMLQQWILLKDQSESFQVLEPENVEVDTKTISDFGRVTLDSFDINASYR